MSELDHRAERFLDSIRDEGESSCAEIRAKTAAERKAALAQARREEKKKAAQTVEFETARAEIQGNKSLSEQRAAIRAELAAERGRLQQSVFDAAEQKLREFTESKDYAPWLEAGAKEMAAALGEGAVLRVRTADLPLLQGKLPEGCRLEADDTIRLGGLRGCSDRNVADDTLESRLSSQREWFLEHSGLSITL